MHEPIYSNRYISSLFGKHYNFDGRFKEWMLYSQAYLILEFDVR